jgi:hypothetical protein
MQAWYLIVETPTKNHKILVGGDESDVIASLEESKKLISANRIVTVADRLALPGRMILSLRLLKTQP